MKVTLKPRIYYGNYNNKSYIIDDVKAASIHAKSVNQTIEQFVHLVLTDVSLWDADLSLLNGFEEQLVSIMKNMKEKGVMYHLNEYLKQVAK